MPEYNPEELDPMWDDSHIDRSIGDDAFCVFKHIGRMFFEIGVVLFSAVGIAIAALCLFGRSL